jgi:hypothetical protein
MFWYQTFFSWHFNSCVLRGERKLLENFKERKCLNDYISTTKKYQSLCQLIHLLDWSLMKMMFSYKHVRKVDQGPLSFLFVNHCRKLWTTLFILNSANFFLSTIKLIIFAISSSEVTIPWFFFHFNLHFLIYDEFWWIFKYELVFDFAKLGFNCC